MEFGMVTNRYGPRFVVSGGIMRKWMAFLAIALAGCMAEPEEDCAPVKDTVFVNVVDTIFSDPPLPGAPLITSLKSRQAEGQDGRLHYYIDASWTDVQAAIGYRVYWSTHSDTGYSVMSTGTFYGSSKSGMYTYTSGILFFKVAAVNNSGIEGPKSPHSAVVYDGVQ